MDMGDFGKGFEGVERLARIGEAAILIGFLAIIVGVPVLIWWAWNHVSIAIN